MSLRGQWMTPFAGNNGGMIVIDLDELEDRFEGTAVAWYDNPELPNFWVRIRTPSKATTQHLGHVPIQAIDDIGNVLTFDTIQALSRKGIIIPSTVEIDFALNDDILSVKWTSSVGSSGAVQVPKTRGGLPSELTPVVVTKWDDFKKTVNLLERKRYIFRGQASNKWRLRTSFHRTGRTNLENYLRNDILDLRKVFSALTEHAFNLNDPLDHAAFISLAQHHGYPTPMLDWTWSPYVAAFFAVRNKNAKGRTGNKVRIFKFDIVEWSKLPPINCFPPGQT